MTLLLDTHVLLWWFFGDKKLSDNVSGLIAEPGNKIMVSSASAWEISTKFRLGKLPGARIVVERLPRLLIENRMKELSISTRHALQAGSYQTNHRDPFDRMLAAQSEVESIPLASSDQALRQFGIEIVW